MQQGRERITLCVLTHGRPREVAEAVRSVPEGEVDEILVLDNGSDPPVPPMDNARWLRSEVNLGVSAGRNLLAGEATGDLLFFLDDDAVLASPLRVRATAAFGADPRLAVLALGIRRDDGTMVGAEYPYRGRAPGTPVAGPCAYFLGGAAIVRRSAFEALAGFDPLLHYSSEEIDLAMRLMAAGWRLHYEPAISVIHRPSSRGRLLRADLAARQWTSRSVFARRHLPLPVAAVHLALWSAKTAVEAGRTSGLAPWSEAWIASWRMRVLRQPLPWPVLRRVHELGGRVWW